MPPFPRGTHWRGFGLSVVARCCCGLLQSLPCFSNALLFAAFVSSSGLLGRSPDPRRCQSPLHPASVSPNRGISAARMLRVATSVQGKKAQEPLCLRLTSPGIPCWSLKRWEDFSVEEEGRKEEGRMESGVRSQTCYSGDVQLLGQVGADARERTFLVWQELAWMMGLTR